MKFAQSFSLPQGSQGVTRPGGVISTIIGYVGEDPLQMIRDISYEVIVLESGYLVPLSLLAPAYGTTTSHFNPEELFHKVLKKWMILHKASLFDLMFTVVCPNHTDDPTAVIYDVCQSYMDHQENITMMTTDKYILHFMRISQPLARVVTATIT